MAGASISIRAETPNATVMPRASGRNLIRLPSLVYTFSLRAECPDQYMPESLLVNVADTRKSFNTAQIAAGDLLAIELRIPRRQIAPVPVGNFCVVQPVGHVGADTTVSDTNEQLIVYDVLSAQASLMCANDADRTMTYASQTLDVLLVCETPVKENTSDSTE